ncbi:MAG: helix-turn-helix domain-containing protein [Saprospiraceae bacterium]
MIKALLQLTSLQSFLLFLFLIFTRTHKISNYFLAAFALIVSILCFFRSMEDVSFYIQYPHLMRVEWGMLLLLWPLVYLFVKYFLSLSPNIDSKDVIHFVPYAVNLIILLPFFLQNAESKIQMINHYTPFITQGFYGYNVYFKVLSIVVGIQSLVYTSMIMGTVKSHKASIEQLFSDTSRFGASWFYIIVYGMVGLSMLYIMSLSLNATSLFLEDYLWLFFLGLFLMIVFLSYRSFYQPFYSQTIPAMVGIPVENLAVKSTYAESGISEMAIQKLASELTHIFENEKRYLKADLNVAELSESIGAPRQYLSQVLSQHFHKSFYDYVNDYRVKEFKSRLSSGKYSHLTLIGLAFECGFNSKSSFNSVFKKSTGITPSAFAATVKKS